MPGTLRTLNLIPTADPYADAGQPYAATGNFTFVPAGQMATTTSAIINNNNVEDWIFVELRNASNPAIVVASKSGLLKSDGIIINPDGTAFSFTGVAEGNYHIAIKHRNHLAIRTLSPQAVPTSGTYDFTTGTGQAYTDGSITTNANMRQVGSVYALWGGDANLDGHVRYTDDIFIASDALKIYSDLGFDSQAQLNTYHASDVNLDGYVRYTDDIFVPSDALVIYEILGFNSSNQLSKHF